MTEAGMRTTGRMATTVAVLAGLPSLALAHVGVGSVGGLAAGLWHPLSGLDHLLAMVAVGTWAALLGGRLRWLVPGAFLVVMAAGAAWGAVPAALPGGEILIALSVVVFGLLVAGRVQAGAAVALSAVALLAFAHGHAHGVEMPANASGFLYGLGFVAAAAALHGCGIGIGAWLASRSPKVTRWLGSAVAAAGAGLLAWR